MQPLPVVENLDELEDGPPGQAAGGRWRLSSSAFKAAKTINGLYKAEVIRKKGPWKEYRDVEYATLEWVIGTTPLASRTLSDDGPSRLRRDIPRFPHNPKKRITPPPQHQS